MFGQEVQNLLTPHEHMLNPLYVCWGPTASWIWKQKSHTFSLVCTFNHILIKVKESANMILLIFIIYPHTLLLLQSQQHLCIYIFKKLTANSGWHKDIFANFIRCRFVCIMAFFPSVEKPQVPPTHSAFLSPLTFSVLLFPPPPLPDKCTYTDEKIKHVNVCCALGLGLIHKHKAHDQKKGTPPSRVGVMLQRTFNHTSHTCSLISRHPWP